MDFKEVVQKFIDWTKKKVRHHIEEDPEKYFREKEVWWAAMGKNIGYEIDGKNELFLRPVLILKKYSKDMSFILPLSTKIKKPTPWYHCPVKVDNKDGVVVLSQGRSMSSKRLLSKLDNLNSEVYEDVLNKFIEQFAGK